MVVNLCIW